MKKIILISGPSCVGKGPLIAAYKEFNPNTKVKQVEVIKSKESRNNIPRPYEIDVWDNKEYFRTNEEIINLKNDPNYFVGECRGYPQAININHVVNLLQDNDIILIEVYHTIGADFAAAIKKKKINVSNDVLISTIFISPLPVKEAIRFDAKSTNDIENLILIMKNKQLLRGMVQRLFYSEDFDKMIYMRAISAVDEMKSAKHFDEVIYVRDGEGHYSWNMNADLTFNKKPVDGALLALKTFENILNS